MNKKRNITFILTAIVFFSIGYLVATIYLKNNFEQENNVFGTYTHDFSTISINHDLTYQYSSPFTLGQLKQIDEQVYKLNDGDLNEYIIFFSKDSLKLIDIKNDTSIKIFDKKMDAESDLKDNS